MHIQTAANATRTPNIRGHRLKARKREIKEGVLSLAGLSVVWWVIARAILRLSLSEL
ncbi:MAG: hypothetical protein ACJ73N_11175 [Bryobacteraceae bacterium]